MVHPFFRPLDLFCNIALPLQRRVEIVHCLGMHSDTIVVGAGPIGIEVAAALRACGNDCRLIEAGQIGATIMRYPRNTVFFSSPEWIAICGIPIQSADQRRITGEEYLAYLRQVVETLALPLQTYTTVEHIEPLDRAAHPAHPVLSARFRVHTRGINGEAAHSCRAIVLAIGDMHRPNLLGIPGEELATVSHYFDDPHRYFQSRFLIVGGRNSALEAALRSWRAGARVALSYHRTALPRRGVLARNRLEVSLLIKHGQIEYLPCTRPIRVQHGSVELEQTCTSVSGGQAAAPSSVAADFVLLATGFRPDTRLYQQIGIKLEGAEQRPRYDPATLETNIAGIYVAGTATAGNQKRYHQFISTCHHHASRIAYAITGCRPPAVGNLPARNYDLSPEEIE